MSDKGTELVACSSNLLRLRIAGYFSKRGLIWPSVDDALAFALTELAECVELRLAKKSWVRNNPEQKEAWSRSAFTTEVGDVIMMLIVATMHHEIDLDPIVALMEKMDRKLEERP